MYDPRWDDARERDDGRARVYEQRDQTEHDPRDGLMHDLDLPRSDARELVIDRDRVYASALARIDPVVLVMGFVP